MKLINIALVVMLDAATAHAQAKGAQDKDEAGEGVKNAAALGFAICGLASATLAIVSNAVPAAAVRIMGAPTYSRPASVSRARPS